MPGHMNVLLSRLMCPTSSCELEQINDEFAQTDVCVVVGANDVMNPAARDTDDTPISGMPILNVDQAKHIIVCNYDLKPGYAGVDNPIYSRKEGVTSLLGDAAQTLQQLLDDLQNLRARAADNRGPSYAMAFVSYIIHSTPTRYSHKPAR